MKEWSDEEYRSTHFFNELIVDAIHSHLSHIHVECIVREIYLYIETLDNLKKCENISYARNILESDLIEEETRCDCWETCILWPAYFDSPGEALSSLDFEHGILIMKK